LGKLRPAVVPAPPARLYLVPEAIPAHYGRVPSLDGLRALSILIVMASHFISSQLFPGGFGVLVFFVISGFLITRLLFAELKGGSVGLVVFYVRRILRLYPVILVYTLTVVVMFLITNQKIKWIEPLSALFYFANYLYAYYSTIKASGEMPFGIFWSLSVEEHFYVIFPTLFVMMVGRAAGTVRLAKVMIAVCVLCLGLRFLLAGLKPAWLHSYVFYQTDIRVDTIAYGVLLAVGCEIECGRRFIRGLTAPSVFILACVTILACFVLRTPEFRETLRYSVLGGSVAVVMAAILFSPRYRFAQSILNHPVTCWIGVLSYSLYVWHVLCFDLIDAVVPGMSSAELATVEVLLSFVLASISYYGIERPFMRLRHQFGSRAIA
jgi:peptidoglycan/LPS O-acetylase OafA/YrhL